MTFELQIGSGAGTGYNVNIAFSGPQLQSGYCPSSCGDPEYLAAFRCVFSDCMCVFSVCLSVCVSSVSAYRSVCLQCLPVRLCVFSVCLSVCVSLMSICIFIVCLSVCVICDSGLPLLPPPLVRQVCCHPTGGGVSARRHPGLGRLQCDRRPPAYSRGVHCLSSVLWPPHTDLNECL